MLDSDSTGSPPQFRPATVVWGYNWSLQDSILSVNVDSPVGTKGALKLSKDWACAGGVSSIEKCAHMKDYVRSVKGGGSAQFKVYLGTLRDIWLH